MKYLKINYLLLVVLAMLLTLALWPSLPWFAGAENRLAQIKTRGVLRVSTINSPLTYCTDNLVAAGLDYELAQRFADYLGVRLQIIVRPNFSDLFDDLEHDRADILAAGLIRNRERLQHFRTGPGYYSVSQQLVYRIGGARPKNPGALQGHLTIAAGSASLSILRSARESNYPDLNWTVSPDQSPQTLLKAVADGRLDYTIGDSVTIALMQRVHPQLAVAFDITDEEPITWYLPRDSDNSVDAAVSGFFNSIDEDGTMARLEEKYLGHAGAFDYVDTRSFLNAIDTVLPDIRPLFEQYAQVIDWHLLAAIAYQESHWNPQATSPTGVRGIMMLTRSTADSLHVTDRTDPAQSIRGGSEYLARIIDKVPTTIPKDERIWFALAAYNMGYAHMLDARKLTEKQQGNPDSWADVKMRLPMLSHKHYYSQSTWGYAHGQEAFNYVENIRKYQLSLVGYLKEQDKKTARQKMPESAPGKGYATTATKMAIRR